MLNIDTRLLDLVQNKVITTDDFFVLISIAKRINNKFQSFPSRALLVKETNFSKDKVSKCLSSLITAGLLEKSQINSGKFGSNLYTIKTTFIGVYLGAENQTFTEPNKENTETQNTDTENPCTENKPLSIRQSLSIRHCEEGAENFKFSKHTQISIEELKSHPTLLLQIDRLLNFPNYQSLKSIPNIENLILEEIKFQMESKQASISKCSNYCNDILMKSMVARYSETYTQKKSETKQTTNYDYSIYDHEL